MSTIDLQDLAHDPSAVLDRVKAGECLVVSREGKPVAELRPIAPAAPAPRPFGLAAGAFAVPASFDEPLPIELLQEFEAR